MVAKAVTWAVTAAGADRAGSGRASGLGVFCWDQAGGPAAGRGWVGRHAGRAPAEGARSGAARPGGWLKRQCPRPGGAGDAPVRPVGVGRACIKKGKHKPRVISFLSLEV